MTEEKEQTLKKLGITLADSVIHAVSEIAGELTPQITKYATQLSHEFALQLWRSYGQDDEIAKRNLQHLKAQVKQLAVLHQLQMHRLAVDRLNSVLSTAFNIAWSALKVLM